MNETVTIERMGNDANAIAHLASGKTVFVAGGAPGDVANVEILEEKATFARGRVVELLESSALRVAPACPHASYCGGCSWQHLDYSAQLDAKRANVLAALTRTAHFNPDAAEALVKTPLPSKRQWGYRNKLELNAQVDKQGQLQLGFCAEGSHDS